MELYLGMILMWAFLQPARTEPLYKHSQDTTAGGAGSMPKPLPGIPWGSNSMTQQDYSYILPISWQQFCKVGFRLIEGSNISSRHAFEVTCHPRNGDYWSLRSYREWIDSFQRTFYRYIPNNQELAFAFRFHCHDSSAQISLPYPVKALHLWYMSIDNCTITDQLLEYNLQHRNIPDTLGVLQIANSIITLDTEQFFMKTKNYLNTSRDFYCGSEVLEKFVLRNNSKIFTKPKLPEINLAPIKSMDAPKDTRNLNEQENASKSQRHEPKSELEMNDIFAKFTQDHLKVMYRCTHKKLRFLEESYQKTMSRHHSHFMLENARYPELRYFNMSRSGIVNMGPHMLDWRRYFPKMKYMDLSYNRIKYFSSLTDNGMSTDTGGVLDLRHNNITSLTPDDLEALRLHSRTVFVDIRDNPIVCDCKLKNVIELLHNNTYQSKLDQRYKYLQDLTCTSPLRHKGKLLSSLEEEFCEFLEYILLSTPLVIVSSLSVISLAIFIVAVRYRKEIMILAFTRLNISLPCRKVYKSNDKKYDAFIAYSEQDSNWVFNTLLPRLEDKQENNGPGLKLCIHHRDFPIGGAISDNILDKIKESRHTVLILSNNFLRSHWCKYEFRAAFTQSLMEKKQHLIMVLQEELDKALIEKTLQRCLKTFTYVKADDKLFWDKLIYALSDREEYTKNTSQYSCKLASSYANNSKSLAPNGNLSRSQTTPNISQKSPIKPRRTFSKRSLPIASRGHLLTSMYSHDGNLSHSLNDPNFSLYSTPNRNLSRHDLSMTLYEGPSNVSIISYPSLNGTRSLKSVKSDISGVMKKVSVSELSNVCDTISMDTENGHVSFISNSSDITMDTDSSVLQDSISNLTNDDIGVQYSTPYMGRYTTMDNLTKGHDDIEQCVNNHEQRNKLVISSDHIEMSDIIDYYSIHDSENDEVSFKESRITLDDADFNDNEKCDSLTEAMSPWMNAWFSGSTGINGFDNM